MTDRYYVSLSGRGRAKLAKKAEDYHTSLSRLIRALGRAEWERAEGEPERIQIGPRPLSIHMPLQPEDLARFQQICYDHFIISGVGSRDVVGLVLEAWLTGRIKLKSKLSFQEQEARKTPTNRNPTLHISSEAWGNLKARYHTEDVTTAVQAMLVQYPFPNWYTYHPDPDAVTRRRGRRIGFTLEAIKHMAVIAKHIGLKPDREYVEASWAAAFLEELGIGTIFFQPQQEGDPRLLSRIDTKGVDLLRAEL